jgi:uncharacterized RDD family membrane protein YckC
MESTNIDIKKKDSGYSSLDADVFVPLDLNWRRTYYRSSFIKRILAYVIDIFITSVPACIIAFLFSIFFLPMIFGVKSMKDIPESHSTELGLAFILWETIFLLLTVALMESSRWKGTFGKRIMKIEITDSYGNPISFGKALIRNVLKFLVTLSYGLGFPLIIQLIMFVKTKQLFHDKFSDTIVGERLW